MFSLKSYFAGTLCTLCCATGLKIDVNLNCSMHKIENRKFLYDFKSEEQKAYPRLRKLYKIEAFNCPNWAELPLISSSAANWTAWNGDQLTVLFCCFFFQMWMLCVSVETVTMPTSPTEIRSYHIQRIRIIKILRTLPFCRQLMKSQERTGNCGKQSDPN